MNLKYMLFKDRFVFSYSPKLTLFSADDENKKSNEISLFLKELTLYGVSMNLLTKQTPNSKVKNELLNIAFFCAEEKILYDSIKANRKLPIKNISASTYKNKSFIEKWQFHIIAYFLLLSNKNYYRLKNYLNIKNTRIDEENNDVVAIDIVGNQKNKLTGIIVKTSSKSVIIITPQGDFFNIRPDNLPEISVGMICSGDIKKDISYYKYPIAFVAISFLVAILISFYIYTKPSRTILIEGNFSVTIKTNAWDKTVGIKPLSPDGRKIINSLNLLNKSMDDSIYLIIKQAHEEDEENEKNIVTEKTQITIFITGSKKESPNLARTSIYISEHNLLVSVNNNGVEHKIKKVQK